MRSLTVLAAFTAVASAAAGWTQYTWSYKPDKTADWYKQRGLPLPELAPELTVVEEARSYVVKLECLGCPFRVRTLGTVETWQEPPQDNSLLLNFTINDAESTLLVNGDRMLPLGSRPPSTTAFQIPANTSAEIMGKMTSMHMLDDETWNVGTKYGRFELQYERTQLATKQPDERWLQFDVTGIHERLVAIPRSYNLRHEGQKMVQLLLARQRIEDKLSLVIKDVQVVERKDREQPIKTRCGNYAMIQTKYNPLEWDYYGKIGTYSRMWHRFADGAASFIMRNLVTIIILAIVFGGFNLFRWRNRRANAKAVALVKEDAEAALLTPEYDDAPPQYVDVPEIKVHEAEDE